jgi:hypothetical protein
MPHGARRARRHRIGSAARHWPLVDTAGWYRFYSEVEAAGSSPTYERLSLAIADDAELIALLDELPGIKRQPNLLLAACRILGAPLDDPGPAIEFMHERWDEVAAQMLARATQTNEAARTATFLPLLAQIDGPIALIEVGSSAGLCLYPDRYRIRYDDGPWCGPDGSPVEIDVRTTGEVPVVGAALDVVSRVGIDLAPLDVNDAADVGWLSACIWPEHIDRQERLRAAVEVVSQDPPQLVQGDLVECIDDVLASVPAGATPVVFHSAVLGYLPGERRAAFAERIHAHPGVRWFSNEGPGVMEGLETELTAPDDAGSIAFFVVGVDGRGVAGVSDPHGRWLRWAG